MCSHFDRVQLHRPRLPPPQLLSKGGGKERRGKIVFEIAGCPSNMERGAKKREIIGRHFRGTREIYIGRALRAGGDAY